MREREKERSFLPLQRKHSVVTCWIFPSLSFVSVLAPEEVYREAVTDGYVVDNVYFNWFTTEASKTHGAAQTSQQGSAEEGGISEASGDTSDEAETSGVLQHGGKATTAPPRAWSTEQPWVEGSGDTSALTSVFPLYHVSTTASVSPDWSTQPSAGSDLLEGSGDTTDVSVFLQNGSKHTVSTTESVSPGWSTDQPSSHSEESVSLRGSGATTDLPIFSQRGPDASATASLPHTWSPSTAALPGDADGSGSGDVWLSNGEIIHSTTHSSVSVSSTDARPTSSISPPVPERNLSQPENTHIRLGPSPVQSGKRTKKQLRPSEYVHFNSCHLLSCIFFSISQEPQKEEPTLLPSVGQRTPGLSRKFTRF